MHPIIQELEAAQVKIRVPAFRVGDNLEVKVKVKEGNRERLQSFEGIVIARRNRGLNSAFTVRKISHGVGVERVFQTFSPLIASIEIKRRGDVRLAKLYYLRDLRGRAARIPEKLGGKVNRESLRSQKIESDVDVPQDVDSTNENPSNPE